LTCLATHNNSILTRHTGLFLLARYSFTLLHAIAGLMNVVLFRCCRSCDCNTWFSITYRALVTDFFRWFSIHWVCLCFASWDDVLVSRFDLLILIYQLNRVYLVLINAYLLFLVLRYQIV